MILGQGEDFFRAILTGNSKKGPKMSLDFLPVTFPKGIESARDFPNITAALMDHGYSEPEIRKIMPEASPPDFRAMDADRGSLLLEYRSQRGLCMLAEGFALGVGDHYGYDFDVRQSTCTHRGDPFCTLHITWTADDG